MEKRKLHWTIWKNLCFPLDEKGLNVFTFSDMAKTFDMKLLYKLRENNSLWANFMIGKYVCNNFPGDKCPKPSNSMLWKRFFLVSKLTKETVFGKLILVSFTSGMITGFWRPLLYLIFKL